MTKVAIVEDDIYLRDELMLTFKRKGYSVTGISSFNAVEKELIALNPDIVILDVNLPGKSGYELCKYLKAHTSFPILILTARDTLSDELTALGLGADDFLTKPCHPERLIARIEHALLVYSKVRGIIQLGSLTLDTDTYKLVWQGSALLLPETEGKILQLLLERSPALVSRSEIFCHVWGTEEFLDENILQVNMTRLRKSLSALGLEQIIKTVRGKGYVLEADTL